MHKLIKQIAECADSSGIRVYLVGGFVRDMLMRQDNLDLDIVVEGRAMELGKLLRKTLGASLVEHKRFGTCSLFRADGSKIDIASARKEKYERPAALPVVEFSSLRDDLYRRDFTINAMAARITGRGIGEVIDFFGGMDDLKKGVIRALHDKSFVDDPTRVFRAVRFEQRFAFKIERCTEKMIKNAVKTGMFGCTENQRLREEIILILSEASPEKAVLRMKALAELRFIHKALKVPGSIGRSFKEARAALKWYNSFCVVQKKPVLWLVYLMIMLDGLSVKHVKETADKFVFSNEDKAKLILYKEKEEQLIKTLSVPTKLAPSRVYRLLEHIPHEVLIAVAVKSRVSFKSKVAASIKTFLARYSGVSLSISGSDIKKEGLAPSPAYKKILDTILDEKLDGLVKTKKDELASAKRKIKVLACLTE